MRKWHCDDCGLDFDADLDWLDVPEENRHMIYGSEKIGLTPVCPNTPTIYAGGHFSRQFQMVREIHGS